MKPPVISRGKLKGELIVLVIVFSYIDMEAVAADIVERTAGDLDFFGTAFSADITALDQFFPDLGEILLKQCDIKGCLNGFQMIDLFLYFQCESGKRLVGSLQLSVFLEIFFCIFRGGKKWVKRDGDHLSGIVIKRFHGFGTGGNVVAVGVEKFPVDLVLVLLFGILHLFYLQVIFFDVALKSSLYDPAKIGRFLTDAGNLIFLGIVLFKESGNGGKFHPVVAGKGEKRQSRKLCRSTVFIDNDGFEISSLHSFHHRVKGFK